MAQASTPCTRSRTTAPGRLRRPKLRDVVSRAAAVGAAPPVQSRPCSPSLPAKGGGERRFGVNVAATRAAPARRARSGSGAGRRRRSPRSRRSCGDSARSGRLVQIRGGMRISAVLTSGLRRISRRNSLCLRRSVTPAPRKTTARGAGLCQQSHTCSVTASVRRDSPGCTDCAAGTTPSTRITARPRARQQRILGDGAGERGDSAAWLRALPSWRGGLQRPRLGNRS